MSCPDLSALQEAVEAPPASPRSEALKAHFEQCAECRALVLMLTAESPGAAVPAQTQTQTQTQTIGRYEVLHRLGEGGMGVVYAAHDPQLDRKIAIKLMRRSALGGDANAEVPARLLREAHALARLNHPNVIIVHDAGLHGEGVFIAMELVEGETLGRWMAQPRPWRDTLDLFLRAGRGLEAAHAAGLVHRDFKPDNVLVGKDGRVRVTDFGLARMVTAEETSSLERELAPASPLRLQLTGSGMLMGTPAYMAPEQLGGAPADVRTDVFSFCVALFEGLYRQRPFIGATLQELRDAIMRDRVAAVADGEVPRRLRPVLARGLRAAPGERHPDMKTLLAAIEDACAEPRPRLPRAGAIAIAGALALGVAMLAMVRARHGKSAPSSASAPPSIASTVAVSSPSSPLPASPSSSPSSSPSPSFPSAPPSGTLVVHVHGQAAQIELDGNIVAQAASRAQVSVDATREHQLRVTAPGYRPYAAAVRVGAGAIVDKEVALARAARHRDADVSSPSSSSSSSPSASPSSSPPPSRPSAPEPTDDPNAAIDPYVTAQPSQTP